MGKQKARRTRRKITDDILIWSCEMLTFTRAIPITLPGQETQNTHGMYILSTFTARLFPLPCNAGNVMFTVTLWHYRDRVFLFLVEGLPCAFDCRLFSCHGEGGGWICLNLSHWMTFPIRTSLASIIQHWFQHQSLDFQSLSSAFALNHLLASFLVSWSVVNH